MKWKRMMAVAAMLVAAVLALSACDGQEAPAPEETAEQQVLFDVTRFIGVDEAGLVAIMGEPDGLTEYESDGKAKDYVYDNVSYTFNGEQGEFDHLTFFLRMAEDGTYIVKDLGIYFYYSIDKNEFFAIPANTDIFALFGINTDLTVSKELPEWKIEKHENVIDGINRITMIWNDKTDTEYLLVSISVGYD